MSSVDLDEWVVDDKDGPGSSTESPRRPKGMTAGQTIVKKVNNSPQHILYIYSCLGKIDTFLVNESFIMKPCIYLYTYLYTVYLFIQ